MLKHANHPSAADQSVLIPEFAHSPQHWPIAVRELGGSESALFFLDALHRWGNRVLGANWHGHRSFAYSAEDPFWFGLKEHRVAEDFEEFCQTIRSRWDHEFVPAQIKRELPDENVYIARLILDHVTCAAHPEAPEPGLVSFIGLIQSGAFEMLARAKSGGPMEPMSGDLWQSEFQHLKQRFTFGLFSPDAPFSPDARGTHWIFVDAPSFNQWLNTLSSPVVAFDEMQWAVARVRAYDDDADGPSTQKQIAERLTEDFKKEFRDRPRRHFTVEFVRSVYWADFEGRPLKESFKRIRRAAGRPPGS